MQAILVLNLCICGFRIWPKVRSLDISLSKVKCCKKQRPAFSNFTPCSPPRWYFQQKITATPPIPALLDDAALSHIQDEWSLQCDKLITMIQFIEQWALWELDSPVHFPTHHTAAHHWIRSFVCCIDDTATKLEHS